ncbi:MAG: DUF1800 family protein [Phycisphaerae bacterium]
MVHLLASTLALVSCIGPTTDPLATSDAWSEGHAAHLLRRAGFGGTPDQIKFLAGLGRKQAVDILVDFEQFSESPFPLTLAPHRPPLRFSHPDLDRDALQKLRNQRRRADRLQFERIVQWWIETMVSTPRPLQEKLTLFWHGHFTSGYREVRSSLAMIRQNRLFRSHAAGNFRELLIDISKDPAMILYLNTQQNRKGKPNENYARELMELFTLGSGHYSEQDIRESARAFTGLGVDFRTGETIFRRRQHDDGEKTFLGKTGPFGPEDIVDIILEQPAAAKFMARKLWTYFAYENPEEEIVHALAKVFRDGEFEIKPVLTRMFMSDAFYSDRARFTKIKSPVELLVGTLRMLEIPPVDTRSMFAGLAQMGQQLMQPPNVKGWDGGATWITTSTLFDRYNMTGALLAGNDNERTRRQRERQRQRLIDTLGDEAVIAKEDTVSLQPTYNPMPTVRTEGLKNIGQVVDHFTDRLLQRKLPPERRRVLIDALKQHINTRNVQTPANASGIRGLIHLITSMPEYQLS